MSESGTEQATDTAGVLAGIWRELLDVEAVGSEDRLLELGGNSLVATMIANRIELAWGFRPGLELLLTTTFHELTELCEQNRH